MTTVPHTPAPCEPLTTLIAECFGDQPTPASPLPERLHKALALVLAHAVTLHPDGTASVQSGTQTYRLAPDCPCADATHRAELCKHRLAVELHRRTLTLLAGMAPASSPTAAGAPARAASSPSAEAPPAATPPAAEGTRQEWLPSADRWDVNEAPASCCLRLRVGEIELMYTMRDVSDAELTSRVQHLVPWVQDVLDLARERQAHLDTLRQQREAAQMPALPQGSTPPAVPEVDLQAVIQHAVHQALAAQAAANGTPPATSQAPEAETPAGSEGWCDLHQVAMERRSNTRGSWWSHWIASEKRYCKGK